MAGYKRNLVRLNISVTPEQYEYLYHRSQITGISISDLIKLLIVEDWRVMRAMREKYLQEIVEQKIKDLGVVSNKIVDDVEKESISRRDKIVMERHKRGLLKNNRNSIRMEEKIKLSRKPFVSGLDIDVNKYKLNDKDSKSDSTTNGTINGDNKVSNLNNTGGH